MTARLIGGTLMTLAAGGALAQGSTPQSQPAMRQTQTAGAGQASSLQDYVQLLQAEETKLQAARDEADRGPAQSQAGAMSQQRMDLMQTLRGAWQTVQRVPAEFAGTAAYQEADRQLRQSLAHVGPTRRLDKAEGVAAADDALRTIAALRQQAAQAGGQTGSDAGAPAVQGGGAR